MPEDDSNKITALEVEVRHLCVQNQSLLKEVQAMRGELNEVNKALTKWKGMAAGVALVISVLWTVVLSVSKFFK